MLLVLLPVQVSLWSFSGEPNVLSFCLVFSLHVLPNVCTILTFLLFLLGSLLTFSFSQLGDGVRSYHKNVSLHCPNPLQTAL